MLRSDLGNIYESNYGMWLRRVVPLTSSRTGWGAAIFLQGKLLLTVCDQLRE